MALPSTVAVSTHRPRAVARCRPPASAAVLAPAEDPASVTPLDVTVEAGGLGVALVRGDPGATGGDRRGCAVPWEHDGFIRQWQQLRGDARHDGFEVAPSARLARAY